ncbi:enoyl-CoA hydratase [Bacillus canaveralius]|uniref:Enoyl-CoA hydratase n=1 Tax=Bacillus canaveralius TaxID=1403243 RepID=A0A2N5GNM0_9BACI|nr:MULTISPECIES: enoyl-CoA hydratase/isomerase family protein [Bacillus]PLR80988.1 enoyl-CoA hydratase [Bacillus sp. V33-4]PLR84102.1 enoyl-CoA hydratase [Bacillus canaveralius]PLR96252.1 enoyl-CoA hydratase [Bacillus canaveralius]RSK53563.1 enoyl-CoA hydratase/isomerase family protein [Bacillus canaveralius]
MEPYLLKAQNGYLMFTINRPEKRNAINYEIIDGLHEAIEMMKKPELKGLVITGAGDNAFCSGGDLAVFHLLKTEQEAYGMLSKMSEILLRLLLLPKPTFAAMNGTAVGGGCELAAACDFRIAKKGVKAGFVQGKLAITTGWGGGTILAEKIPAANAIKMLMEARVYQTEELTNLGFIDYIIEENDLTFIHHIEKIFPLEGSVLAAYKAMLIRKWLAANIALRIEKEVRECAKLWGMEEHHNQVDKFMNNK